MLTEINLLNKHSLPGEGLYNQVARALRFAESTNPALSIGLNPATGGLVLGLEPNLVASPDVVRQMIDEDYYCKVTAESDGIHVAPLYEYHPSVPIVAEKVYAYSDIFRSQTTTHIQLVCWEPLIDCQYVVLGLNPKFAYRCAQSANTDDSDIGKLWCHYMVLAEVRTSVSTPGSITPDDITIFQFAKPRYNPFRPSFNYGLSAALGYTGAMNGGLNWSVQIRSSSSTWAIQCGSMIYAHTDGSYSKVSLAGKGASINMGALPQPGETLNVHCTGVSSNVPTLVASTSTDEDNLVGRLMCRGGTDYKQYIWSPSSTVLYID